LPEGGAGAGLRVGGKEGAGCLTMALSNRNCRSPRDRDEKKKKKGKGGGDVLRLKKRGSNRRQPLAAGTQKKDATKTSARKKKERFLTTL